MASPSSYLFLRLRNISAAAQPGPALRQLPQVHPPLTSRAALPFLPPPRLLSGALGGERRLTHKPPFQSRQHAARSSKRRAAQWTHPSVRSGTKNQRHFLTWVNRPKSLRWRKRRWLVLHFPGCGASAHFSVSSLKGREGSGVTPAAVWLGCFRSRELGDSRWESTGLIDDSFSLTSFTHFKMRFGYGVQSRYL